MNANARKLAVCYILDAKISAANTKMRQLGPKIKVNLSTDKRIVIDEPIDFSSF